MALNFTDDELNELAEEMAKRLGIDPRGGTGAVYSKKQYKTHVTSGDSPRPGEGYGEWLDRTHRARFL